MVWGALVGANTVQQSSVWTVLSDTFNRADGPIGSPQVGGAWSVPEGAAVIASQKAAPSGNPTILLSECGIPVGRVQADVMAPDYATTGGAVLIRAIDANNHLLAEVFNGGVDLFKRTGGSYVQLAKIPMTLTNSQVYGVLATYLDGDVTIWVDGVRKVVYRLSAADRTTFNGATTTQAGLRVAGASSNASTFDNVLATTEGLPLYTVASDGFGRANSAVSLGNADVGGAWTTHLGTLGISGGKAYQVATLGAWASLPAARNGCFGATLTSPNYAVNGLGLIFRCIDADTFLYVQLAGGQVQLYKYVAPDYTLLANVAFALVNGTAYDVEVVAQETGISVSVDHVWQLNHTLAGGDATTFNGAGATRAGIRFGVQAASMYADDFRVAA